MRHYDHAAERQILMKDCRLDIDLIHQCVVNGLHLLFAATDQQHFLIAQVTKLLGDPFNPWTV